MLQKSAKNTFPLPPHTKIKAVCGGLKCSPGEHLGGGAGPGGPTMKEIWPASGGPKNIFAKKILFAKSIVKVFLPKIFCGAREAHTAKRKGVQSALRKKRERNAQRNTHNTQGMHKEGGKTYRNA